LVAREAFNVVYGEFPYLIADDLLQKAATKRPSTNCVSRAGIFDAIYADHRANLKLSATPFRDKRGVRCLATAPSGAGHHGRA